MEIILIYPSILCIFCGRCSIRNPGLTGNGVCLVCRLRRCKNTISHQPISCRDAAVHVRSVNVQKAKMQPTNVRPRRGLPYLRVTRQSTRRRRVSNLSKGKKEGKEKEGRKGKRIIKITYK